MHPSNAHNDPHRHQGAGVRGRDPEGSQGTPSGTVPPAPSDDATEDHGLAERNLALEKSLQEAEGRVLRASAEFENFRKRVRREQEDERRYAQLPLLRDLLPVLDNLQRALLVEGNDPGLKSGVEMVSQQFKEVLKQHHCQAIDEVGISFDPSQHEAIGNEPRTDLPEGAVTRVERIGYRLHDRVIRPAAVIVAQHIP